MVECKEGIKEESWKGNRNKWIGRKESTEKDDIIRRRTEEEDEEKKKDDSRRNRKEKIKGRLSTRERRETWRKQRIKRKIKEE